MTQLQEDNERRNITGEKCMKLPIWVKSSCICHYPFYWETPNGSKKWIEKTKCFSQFPMICRLKSSDHSGSWNNSMRTTFLAIIDEKYHQVDETKPSSPNRAKAWARMAEIRTFPSGLFLPVGALPSPPPWGWFTGFITTPLIPRGKRTVGCSNQTKALTNKPGFTPTEESPDIESELSTRTSQVPRALCPTHLSRSKCSSPIPPNAGK